VTYRWVLVWMTGYIDTLYTLVENTVNYSAVDIPTLYRSLLHTVVSSESRPPVVCDSLVQIFGQKFNEKRGFKISELYVNLRKFHALYEINLVRSQYHNFCATWVPKMATSACITNRMATALTFFF
jgi:hypothetical protein